LLDLNPKAELEVFDFCRMMPEQEHPELFNALVKESFRGGERFLSKGAG